MRYLFSRLRIFIPHVVTVALILLFSLPAHAVPAVGDPFPKITLAVPDAGADRDYLGIARGKTFTVGDVAAPVVVVEFFSMYCPHCQADAPTTVDLFGRIKKDPRLSQRVKMIGIGVGNSDYEVGIFKKKYRIPFPLFPDGDYTILNLLDIKYTPTYIVVRIDRGKATVVHTQIGRFKDIESFLTTLSSF
jgi:peroxiredoxin